MVKESQEAFKLQAKRKSTYFSSRNVEHVRPIFESTWCALLAACSAVIEEQPTETMPGVVALSLRGFANAVHIAAEFGMAVERDAFITMLAKYTYLDSTRAMGRRNVCSQLMCPWPRDPLACASVRTPYSWPSAPHAS